MSDFAVADATMGQHRATDVAGVPASIWRSEAVRFALLASPFLAAAGAYEVLRALEPLHARIRVAELRELEALLFAVGGGLTVSDVIARATHPVLDVVCGLTYLLFMAEVVALAIYFFFSDRRRTLMLSLGFLVINVVGWSIWLVYPAAPPWYADLHGLGLAVGNTASNPAALARVDASLGLPLFATIYAQSAYVFGAMPSLHASYSTLAVLVCYPRGGVLRVATLLFLGLMAYSAMYLRHHYLVDVVAGVALAVVLYVLLSLALRGRFRELTGGGFGAR
jgi:inositol phosphorylceramide synthase catalytic subunit